jgi:nitronate monooxygenase
VHVRTDPRASPTGYPFKIVEFTRTPAVPSRERICDLGYLREPVKNPDGRLTYRCAAEPLGTYVQKGGLVCETEGRRCLCNGLLADVGLGQARGDGVEPPLVTSGDDLEGVKWLARNGSYTAHDALRWLERVN